MYQNTIILPEVLYVTGIHLLEFSYTMLNSTALLEFHYYHSVMLPEIHHFTLVELYYVRVFLYVTRILLHYQNSIMLHY